MIILGVDPGSVRVGYGLIEKKAAGLKFIGAGLLKISSPDKNQRLVELENSFLKLLKRKRPDLVVLEKIYFVKNLKTAVEVAQSRGVLTLLTAKHKIPLLEYSPLEIKAGVVGHGSADKKMVAFAVAKILKIKKLKVVDDATDALAAAIIGAGSHQKQYNKPQRSFC